MLFSTAPADIASRAYKQGCCSPSARLRNRLASAASVGHEETLAATDGALLDGERAGARDKEVLVDIELARVEARDARSAGNHPTRSVVRRRIEAGESPLRVVVSLERDQVDGEPSRPGDAGQIKRAARDREQVPARSCRTSQVEDFPIV